MGQVGNKPKLPLDVPRMAGLWLNEAMPSIRSAMEQALYKHGEPTIDPVRGATTLCEECGEVAEKALESTRTGIDKQDRMDQLLAMCEELSQVAGYATLLMMSMRGVINKMARERNSNVTE